MYSKNLNYLNLSHEYCKVIVSHFLLIAVCHRNISRLLCLCLHAIWLKRSAACITYLRDIHLRTICISFLRKTAHTELILHTDFEVYVFVDEWKFCLRKWKWNVKKHSQEEEFRNEASLQTFFLEYILTEILL